MPPLLPVRGHLPSWPSRSPNPETAGGCAFPDSSSVLTPANYEWCPSQSIDICGKIALAASEAELDVDRHLWEA
eukprot:2736218-Rhodomonas_salina.1